MADLQGKASFVTGGVRSPGWPARGRSSIPPCALPSATSERCTSRDSSRFCSATASCWLSGRAVLLPASSVLFDEARHVA